MLTGFTKYMLDYLLREKIFAPTGTLARGVKRRYSYADVVVLRGLNTICAGKGKIRHLRHSLALLRDEIGPLKPAQRLDRCLFVLGDELCLRTSAEGGRELRSGQLTLGFFVDMTEVTRAVADCVIPIGSNGEFALTEDVVMAVRVERLAYWREVQQARAKRKAREANVRVA